MSVVVVIGGVSCSSCVWWFQQLESLRGGVDCVCGVSGVESRWSLEDGLYEESRQEAVAVWMGVCL